MSETHFLEHFQNMEWPRRNFHPPRGRDGGSENSENSGIRAFSRLLLWFLWKRWSCNCSWNFFFREFGIGHPYPPLREDFLSTQNMQQLTPSILSPFDRRWMSFLVDAERYHADDNYHQHDHDHYYDQHHQLDTTPFDSYARWCEHRPYYLVTSLCLVEGSDLKAKKKLYFRGMDGWMDGSVGYGGPIPPPSLEIKEKSEQTPSPGPPDQQPSRQP